jgi:hypothetical protein
MLNLSFSPIPALPIRPDVADPRVSYPWRDSVELPSLIAPLPSVGSPLAPVGSPAGPAMVIPRAR